MGADAFKILEVEVLIASTNPFRIFFPDSLSLTLILAECG
jgi:hypothetical protein